MSFFSSGLEQSWESYIYIPYVYLRSLCMFGCKLLIQLKYKPWKIMYVAAIQQTLVPCCLGKCCWECPKGC